MWWRMNVIYRCQESYKEWFEQDIQDGLITGELAVDVSLSFTVT